MEYKLLSEFGAAALNKDVTKHIEAGWLLYGPPIILETVNGVKYGQAVVLENVSSPNVT